VAEERVDQPGRRLGVGVRTIERELELVERVVARLVDARRLRRRSDEEPGEQVRQRRVVLGERDE
jgi:hypothetical protein